MSLSEYVLILFNIIIWVFDWLATKECSNALPWPCLRPKNTAVMESCHSKVTHNIAIDHLFPSTGLCRPAPPGLSNDGLII